VRRIVAAVQHPHGRRRSGPTAGECGKSISIVCQAIEGTAAPADLDLNSGGKVT
jgi:hypothetical protein